MVLCRYFGAVTALTMVASAVATADSFIVAVDRASIVRLEQPASTIIIGNPAIADAVVQGRQMLVITGKSFGSTNLIALDHNGEVITDATVYVQASRDGAVIVQRGQNRVSLACTPNCERVMAIGDENIAFDTVKEQIKESQKMASGQSDNRSSNEPPPR